MYKPEPCTSTGAVHASYPALEHLIRYIWSTTALTAIDKQPVYISEVEIFQWKNIALETFPLECFLPYITCWEYEARRWATGLDGFNKGLKPTSHAT